MALQVPETLIIITLMKIENEYCKVCLKFVSLFPDVITYELSSTDISEKSCGCIGVCIKPTTTLVFTFNLFIFFKLLPMLTS